MKSPKTQSLNLVLKNEKWNVDPQFLKLKNLVGHFNYHNKPFDPRIDDSTMNDLRLIHMIWMEQGRYSTDSLTRILTNGISKFTLQKFEEDKNLSLENDGHDLKFRILSAHDTNITPFLIKYGVLGSACSIKLYKGEKLKENEPCFVPPAFSANLLWELSKD